MTDPCVTQSFSGMRWRRILDIITTVEVPTGKGEIFADLSDSSVSMPGWKQVIRYEEARDRIGIRNPISLAWANLISAFRRTPATDQ
jgi:hypothetical protein